MKLVLVSTPRSGNTWLRYILAGMYQLEQYAVHTPESIDWADLPPRCIVQLHWRNTPEFAQLVAAHGFRVVTICRHPLDVLLSILQFAPHEPQTANWLAGAGGDEAGIYHQAASSPEFLAYATGPRAVALLSVTPEWWHVPGIARMRYEDLVGQSEATLENLTEQLGPAQADIKAVLAPLHIDKLRLTTSNHHFWKGQPGLWRKMIPMEAAIKMVRSHRGVMESLHYPLEEFA
jgi:hypothetical protein